MTTFNSCERTARARSKAQNPALPVLSRSKLIKKPSVWWTRLVMIALLAALSVGATQANHPINPPPRFGAVCNGPFDPQPDGILHTTRGAVCDQRDASFGRCFPIGLCFPSFNAYSDNKMLRDVFSDERRFLSARRRRGGTDTSFGERLEVQVGDRIQFLGYVHNVADQFHNTDDAAAGAQPRSVARNVRTYVRYGANQSDTSGTLQYDRNVTSYATDLQDRFFIHQFIAADNTVPQAISDSVEIVSADGSPIRLRYVERATSGAHLAFFQHPVPVPGQQSFCTLPDGTRTNQPCQRNFTGSALFGSGAGFGSPDTSSTDYFGSEDYRGLLVFVLEVVAPPPPVECTQLTLTPTLIPTGTTSQQFTVSVDPPDYSGDINWIHTRNGLTWSRATVPGRSGTFTVNELNQTSAVDVIATLGNAPACRARAIVQPPRFDACRSLTITPNTLGPGVTQQEFEIAIDPMSFAGSITAQHIKNGTVVDSTTVQNYKLLFRVTGIDATSVIRATATPDEPTGVCVGEVRPTDEPPPPPPIACTSLTASPTLIERGQSTQTFQASITPASGFTPTITWVHSRPGEPDEVVTAASATFTTLNDSSTIRVSATPVAPGATCAATIPVRPGGGGAPDCQALSVSPNQILRDNPRQSFSANVFPNNFPGTVTWTHVRPGLPPETQTGRSVTFTTLTNDSRINVQGAPVASGASCQADLSVAPPGGGGGGGPKLKCEDLTVEPDVIPRSVTAQANNELTFSALAEPLNFFGGFTWVRKEGDRILETITHQPGSRRSTVKFEDLTPRTVIEVEVDPRRVADGRVCKAIIKPQGITRPPDGELVKRAFEVRSRGNVIAPNETAEFQVTFTPLQNVSELTLLDRNMRNGILNGSEGSRIELVKAAFSGRDFKLEVEVGSGNQRADIPRCSELPINANSICYTGSPFTGQSGLRVENMTTTGDIILTYRGKLVNSVITKAYCRTLERSFCGEKFVNEVFDNFDNRANATLFTPCPFLLTQGIGDVILERDLSIGSDISSCGDIPNIEGPIITPKPPPPAKLPGTGPGQIETLRLPRHTICQQSNTNSTSLPEAYRNPIESLSSAICEITSSLANDLERPNVRADITENITRITRFNENLGTAARTITNLNTPGTVGFNTSPNPNFEIYKIKDADLTINTNLPITGGAKTYVIENGDLIINSNIKYDTTPFNLTNIKSIPSIAFIVINGNIKVAPHVTELNGIFVALDTVQTGVTKRDATAKAGQAGKIIGTGESNQQLYIEGLIYGDIEPIFDTRSFIGNARRGTGTIVINYDGRLFYNPPPGIEQVLDLQQEQVAR